MFKDSENMLLGCKQRFSILEIVQPISIPYFLQMLSLFYCQFCCILDKQNPFQPRGIGSTTTAMEILFPPIILERVRFYKPLMNGQRMGFWRIR